MRGILNLGHAVCSIQFKVKCLCHLVIFTKNEYFLNGIVNTYAYKYDVPITAVHGYIRIY